MRKITLVTDEGIIPLSYHKKFKALLKSAGFSVSTSRCDTGAIGGIMLWNPRDIIIFLSSLYGGLKMLDVVLDSIITHLFELKEHNSFFQVNFETKFKDIYIYFCLDAFDYLKKDLNLHPVAIKAAIQAIPETLFSFQESFSPEFIKLIGSPHRLMFKYDFTLKQWLLNESYASDHIMQSEYSKGSMSSGRILSFFRFVFRKIFSAFDRVLNRFL